MRAMRIWTTAGAGWRLSRRTMGGATGAEGEPAFRTTGFFGGTSAFESPASALPVHGRRKTAASIGSRIDDFMTLVNGYPPGAPPGPNGFDGRLRGGEGFDGRLGGGGGRW